MADNMVANANLLSNSSSLSIEHGGKPSRGITKWTAIFNLITGVIGVGIFALAEQAKDGGLAGALIFCFFGAIAVYEGGVLFGESMLAWNAQCDPNEKITSFETFGRAAFGTFGKGIVTITNCTYYMGGCSTYVIFVGNSFYDIAELESRGYSQKTVRMFFIPLYLGLAMFRDLTSLAKLSPLAVLFSVISAYAIVSQAFFDMDATSNWETGDRALMDLGPRGFMPACRVFAFMFAAFGISGMIPTQANEMKDKTQLPFVLKSAIGSVMVIYVLVIVFGYLAYGNFICPQVIINMRKMPRNFEEASSNFDENWMLLPDRDCDLGWTGKEPSLWLMYYIATGTVIPNLILSYPYNLMPVICAIQDTQCANRWMPVGSLTNYVMRLGLVGISLLVALVLDDISTALGTFAAFALPFVTVFFPIVFNWRIRQKLDLDPIVPLRKAFHALLIIGAVLAFVFGMFENIKNIIAKQK